MVVESSRPRMLKWMLAAMLVASLVAIGPPAANAHPAGLGTTWYMHNLTDPQGTGSYLDFLPPIGETDQTRTILGIGCCWPVVSTASTPLADDYTATGTTGEAFLYLKSWNNVPTSFMGVEVEVYADGALIADGYGEDFLLPGEIREFHIELDVTATSLTTGQLISWEVTYYDAITGLHNAAAYPRGVSMSHQWGFELPFVAGGGGGGECSDDPGFSVIANATAVEHPYVDIPGIAITYPGATDQDIPILGCVQEVEPTTCFWEAGGHYDENIHGQKVEPLPADGGPVFGDPHSCATEVRYKYPGVYSIRLHGIDGDGRYAMDHAFVHVAAAVDYEGPMGKQRSGDEVADPPNGRVEDIPSSHDASVTITRDRDGDGVEDGADAGIGSNCEWVPHDGTDEDRDGLPDACDQDWDNDDVLNAWDNCPWTANTAQKDADGDGHGDACASDADKDGVRDARDNCPAIPNGPLAPLDAGMPLDDQGDLDGDRLGDACDPDMDGDHVPDREDAFPRDRSESSDLDGDGIGDNSDPDRDGDEASNTEELAVGTDPDDPLDRPSDARLAALRDGEAASVGGISIPGTLAVAAGVVVVAIVLAVILRPKRL